MADCYLRVALAQVLATADIGEVCATSAGEGADIVLFPEMFSNGYSRFDADIPKARQAWLDAAVSCDSPYVDRFRSAARTNGLAVVATFLEQSEAKPFNTAALIDCSGDIVLRQRKRHICFFQNPEEACAPGETSHVTNLRTKVGDVAVGLMICMDREYPDVAADLVGGGAEIILVPNSCPLVDDPSVGDVRVAGVRAMAFESVVGMAVANYPAPKHDGHSFGANPFGRIIQMGGTGEEIVFADFDIDEIRTAQKTEWFRRKR